MDAHDSDADEDFPNAEPSHRALAKQTQKSKEARRQAQQIEKKNALLHLTEEVALAANKAKGFGEALQAAVDSVCRHTGSPVGHVYAPDDTGLLANRERPLGKTSLGETSVGEPPTQKEASSEKQHFVKEKPSAEEHLSDEQPGTTGPTDDTGGTGSGRDDSAQGDSGRDDSLQLVPTGIWNRGSEGQYETFREATQQTTFALGEGLPGRVVESVEPAWIKDMTEDENFPRAQHAVSIGVKGAFAFPVPLKGEVVAVLEFFSEEAELVDDGLLEVMESIGLQLGRVAEREEARRRLEASEKRYRSLAETAVDAIVVAGEEGQIIDWNRGATEIFGYEKEEVLGRPIEILMPERHKEAHREGMKRVNRTGEGRLLGETVEMEGLRKSGEEFPLELSLSSWTAGGARRFAAIIRDITKRRKLQREVLQVQEEERRRIGEDLHDGAASQLTGASMKLSLLSRKAEGGISEEEAGEAIEEIQGLIKESVADVRRLTRGLSPGGLSEGDLVFPLKELAENTEGACFEGGQPALDLGDDETTHLYRIVQEAVNNARKHAEASEILIRLHHDNGSIRLEVEDDGKGFNLGEVGEGVGLRSMRHRAEFLGAELKIDSAPDEGTLVHCHLPV